MRHCTLVVAGVLLAAVPAGTEGPIAVGVMTQNGFLLPFVQIRGDSISRLTSPDGDTRLNIAAEAAALERSPWMLRTIADASTTEVAVTGRQVIDLGYQLHESWKTTLNGRPWPSYGVPIRKIGLATQGIVAELPEVLVGRTDRDSQRVRALISHLAHRREAQFLETEAGHRVNQYSPEVRARKVVRLDKLWRRRSDGIDTYYFEATKRYEWSHLLLTGWVVVAGGQMTPRFVTFVPADDEHKRGVYRDVLGVIPFRGRELWVMESHYYEGESRLIREWPSGKCAWGGTDDDCG